MTSAAVAGYCGTSGCAEVMIFYPTMEEFKDFEGYIRMIERSGAHLKCGVCKIVPPEEWTPRPKRGKVYDDVGDVIIDSPITQHVEGERGCFTQFNTTFKKKLPVSEYEKLAKSAKYAAPPFANFADMERYYWRNVTYGRPIYGADFRGSLYDDELVETWNINRLPSILDILQTDSGQKISIEGVNNAYMYYGMWKATFPWHTEDMDLYSINYIHFGAPKFWYGISEVHRDKFERLAEMFFPQSKQQCKAFLRHKMYLISPTVLKQNCVPFGTMVQKAGEIMITFPGGYHAGFNVGYNGAESTNFASERWIDFGKKANFCTCRSDTVRINMAPFIERFRPKEWDEYKYWYIDKVESKGIDEVKGRIGGQVSKRNPLTCPAHLPRKRPAGDIFDEETDSKRETTDREFWEERLREEGDISDDEGSDAGVGSQGLDKKNLTLRMWEDAEFDRKQRDAVPIVKPATTSEREKALNPRQNKKKRKKHPKRDTSRVDWLAARIKLEQSLKQERREFWREGAREPNPESIPRVVHNPFSDEDTIRKIAKLPRIPRLKKEIKSEDTSSNPPGLAHEKSDDSASKANSAPGLNSPVERLPDIEPAADAPSGEWNVFSIYSKEKPQYAAQVPRKSALSMISPLARLPRPAPDPPSMRSHLPCMHPKEPSEKGKENENSNSAPPNVDTAGASSNVSKSIGDIVADLVTYKGSWREVGQSRWDKPDLGHPDSGNPESGNPDPEENTDQRLFLSALKHQSTTELNNRQNEQNRFWRPRFRGTPHRPMGPPLFGPRPPRFPPRFRLPYPPPHCHPIPPYFMGPMPPPPPFFPGPRMPPTMCPYPSYPFPRFPTEDYNHRPVPVGVPSPEIVEEEEKPEEEPQKREDPRLKRTSDLKPAENSVRELEKSADCCQETVEKEKETEKASQDPEAPSKLDSSFSSSSSSSSSSSGTAFSPKSESIPGEEKSDTNLVIGSSQSEEAAAAVNPINGGEKPPEPTPPRSPSPSIPGPACIGTISVHPKTEERGTHFKMDEDLRIFSGPKLIPLVKLSPESAQKPDGVKEESPDHMSSVRFKESSLKRENSGIPENQKLSSTPYFLVDKGTGGMWLPMTK